LSFQEKNSREKLNLRKYREEWGGLERQQEMINPMKNSKGELKEKKDSDNC
jgi:hypothetical protein